MEAPSGEGIRAIQKALGEVGFRRCDYVRRDGRRTTFEWDTPGGPLRIRKGV